MKVLFMTLTLILVVLISGCKKNDYQATVGVCPLVVSTIPANGAVGVPLNQVVSATFNEKMNPATITGTSFTLLALTTIAGVNTTTAVAGDVTYSGLTAFFKPANPLTPNTTYTGRVTTAARDLAGNALQTDYVWSFATDLPPTVTSDPANNATGVLLNKVIVATFSVPMDSLTLKTPATNITIKQGTTTVPGKFSYGIKTASFTPTSNLAPFTVYTGTITTGVKNALGTPMAADYVWNFTTIPQLTLSSNPVLGGTTSGAGLFAQGSTVTVVATANTGYTFFNWTDGATVASTSASYSFAMAGNKTLVANFTPKYVVTVLSNPLLGGTTTGGGTFNSGASVTVTAAPNAGFTFTNWTDGVNIVSSSLSYQFTISGNRSLVANYAAIPYTVSVSSNPLLGGTTTGGGTFNSGASVTVAAVPNVGFTFTNWTEGTNIVSTNANYLFTIAGNRTLVANYTAIPYTVAVSSNPLLGGTTSGSGTFNSGASVTVKAVPNAGFTFTNWTEGTNIVSTSANYQFTIAGNRTLVANYSAIPYTVAVSSNPLEGGTTSGSGVFNSGTLVTVTANPNVGYTFTNWTEGSTVVSTNANYQFTISGNRILVANYIPITYTVAVSSNPLIGGTTSGGGTFNSGASVTVHAVANAGYTFTNWTEGLIVASTNANYLFTITGNRTLVANYAKDFTLVVTAVNGSVVKNPNQLTYSSGTSVQLTAVPNSGYTFTSWSGDASGSVNPLTIVMNANKAITANFTIIPPLGPGVVNLGTSGDFTALAMSGISTTGVTSVAGDIGVSPVAATGITGFGLIMDASGQWSHTPIVSGKVYASDYAPPTPAKMTTAVNDMMTAYTTANGLTLGVINELYAGNISGQILPPGLYKWGTGVLITNAGVTLSGGANDTWVFQIAQDLTVNSSAIVTLIGGAQAKNIVWVVAGQALLGPGVDFSGIILSKTLISLNTGAKVTGRLLAQTAVTLNASTVVQP